MNPEEVLTQIRAMGFQLTHRSGGLRLDGGTKGRDEVRALIADHRQAMITLLEADALACAKHEASLAAGRLTAFPEHLHHLVDPVLVRACLADQPQPITKTAA